MFVDNSDLQDLPKSGAAPENGEHSVLNGLAGVAAAVVAEEGLSHSPLGAAAGLVAASVGGLVVYGLDHTDIGKQVEQVLLPSDDPQSILADCLPQTDLLHEAIDLMSRPFGAPPISGVGGPVGLTESSTFAATDSVSDSIYVPEHNDVLPGADDLAAAQAIVDHHVHQGVIICDPPETSGDAGGVDPQDFQGTPNDII